MSVLPTPATATRFAVVVLVIALVTVVSVLMHVLFTQGISELTVEILAAVLAVVLVVASVGVTIHFQAKSETEREFRVKLFEEKLKIYVGLLECITKADDDVNIDLNEMNDIRNRARVAALVGGEPLLKVLAPFVHTVVDRGKLPDPAEQYTYSKLVQSMRQDLNVVEGDADQGGVEDHIKSMMMALPNSTPTPD